MKKVTNKKRIVIITCIFSIIIISITLIFSLIKNPFHFSIKSENEDIYIPVTKSEISYVNEYYIYGNHFNIKGSLNKYIDFSFVKDIKITLHNKFNDIDYNVTFNYDKKTQILNYETSPLINTGILLDNIDINKYFILLKINYLNGDFEYYNLKNNTDFNMLEYYTITKNKTNNYITIQFKSINKNIKNDKELKLINFDFFSLEIINKILPVDVYDIVIDPGHGGFDSGTESDYGLKESDEVLKIATLLKNELESLGLKVKLTRDGDYNPGFIKGKDPYGEKGRISLSYETKAKYFFSIHINSYHEKLKDGGVEIYTPNDVDLSFAKSIADNIVKYAKTNYSKNPYNKLIEGVYFRGFSNEEIIKFISEAKQEGYEWYQAVSTSTPYYYMVRETGGYMTKSYVDGRDSKINKNKYYNSNCGTESYLIELGYIVNDIDLNNIIYNKSGYVQGIKNSLYNKIFIY